MGHSSRKCNKRSHISCSYIYIKLLKINCDNFTLYLFEVEMLTKFVTKY